MQTELARAQALLNKKQPNPDKAIKILQRLLKRYTSSWAIYHYLGVALLQKSEYSKALRYLQNALKNGSKTRSPKKSKNLARRVPKVTQNGA